MKFFRRKLQTKFDKYLFRKKFLYKMKRDKVKNLQKYVLFLFKVYINLKFFIISNLNQQTKKNNEKEFT